MLKYIEAIDPIVLGLEAHGWPISIVDEANVLFWSYEIKNDILNY